MLPSVLCPLEIIKQAGTDLYCIIHCYIYNNNNKTWLAVLASRFDMSFVQVWFIATLGSILDSQLS